MLVRLINFSLGHQLIVIVGVVCLAIFGGVSCTQLQFDAFPDTTPVQVQINTTAPSLSPVEIERQITYPVEQVLSGLPGLTQLRSISKFGFSQVTMIFDDGTDIYFARQVVAERLSLVELPSEASRPTLGPVTTGLGEIFQYVVQSSTMSTEELHTLHHWVIRPRMMQIPGVAEINTWGGHKKQYHIVINPLRLLKYQLTLDDLARVVRQSNRSAGGGVLNQSGESYLIQGQGLVSSVADLRSLMVATVEGVPVFLRDVAEIREGHEIRRGAVSYGGEGEVVLGLGFMLVGENSRELAKKLQARLKQLENSLPEDIKLTEVYSRSKLVDMVLHTVGSNLMEGALLVVAVLFVFLGNFRAGVIVALAIPLSMLFAFHAMLQFGIAGSLMSLGAIDFGLVVDSSVIMVENACRRLQTDPKDKSAWEVVRDAAIEVRKPTLFGELIIIIVYLPILTLEGVEGKLFRPLALTAIFALLGSMLLSLTLMPVLASLLLEKQRMHRTPRLVQWLNNIYKQPLDFVLKYPKQILALAGILILSAALLAPKLGWEFVPRLHEQAIVINTVRMAGISLEESVRYGTRIEKLLLEKYPHEIEHVWTRTGTAEVATDPMGLEVSDVFLTLRPSANWQVAHTQNELSQQMKSTLNGLPGMRTVFVQPIEMRVNEMLAGIRSDVGIKIFGDDFAQLAPIAEELRAAIEQIPGGRDVSVEQLGGQPLVNIRIDREAAARLGVPVSRILDTIEALGAKKIGHVTQGQQRFDLVLRLMNEVKRTPKQLDHLLINTRNGSQVPLSSVASITLAESPSLIQREWAKRRVLVQVNIEGRDIDTYVSEVEQVLESLPMPEGYYTAIGGQFENLQRGRTRLLFIVPLTLLLVFSMLYLSYGRIADAFRVFTSVPFAMVGGIVALYLRGIPLSISASIGFIVLSGVAVLGDMVMVSYINALVRTGRHPMAAVRTAAITRLRPVLMTASVAALGFAPMAFNTGVGSEVQRPIATVILGGMVTSTIATLLLLPVLYVLMSSSSRELEV